jgi:NAD(P)-dependent dehydrogenase (short-subunit alcohol dehydrogenase family)
MSDRLAGATVLVTGASGEVGWGIAHAARDRGAKLVLPARRQETRDQLAAEFGAEALCVVTEATSESSVAELSAAALARFGSIDHVIAPLGAWWSKGASLAQPHSELRALYQTYVDAPWLLLTATAPALARARGSFTFVTGAAGEAKAMPNSGLLVAAVAAQHALSRVLRHELAREPYVVNELRISARIERQPRAGVVPAKEAGVDFLELLISERHGALLRYHGLHRLVVDEQG